MTTLKLVGIVDIVSRNGSYVLLQYPFSFETRLDGYYGTSREYEKMVIL